MPENARLLREILRTLVKNLGILEKDEGYCCGLTYTQYCAVIEIGRLSNISLKDLAEKLGLDKSTMSRAVNNLVKQDLLILETLPENRRFVKINLTEKGQCLFNRIESASEQYYQNILGSIPEDKTQQVMESLEFLLESVRKNKCCNC
jgi:DNA-binding MarR family transcriptional regulator